MLVTIEIDRDLIIKRSTIFLKSLISFAYGWLTTDGEFLGYILAVIHVTIGIGTLVAILLTYTIYPSFWLQLFLTCFVGIVAIQHIILQVCVVTIAETELTNKVSPFQNFAHTILSYLNIDYSSFIEKLITAEVIFVLTSILGLLSRISVYLHGFQF